MHLKIFPKILVLLALVLATVLLLWSRPEPEAELRALAATPVQVGRVQSARLEPTEQVSGYLQPVRRVSLQFQVAGRIAQRDVEPGMLVDAGQVLLVMEDGDYRDAEIQARAEWKQAKQDLERDRRLLELATRSRKLQEQEVDRLHSLSARSLASKTQIGNAEVLLATRLSEEARLQASVNTAPQRIAARRAALDRAERNLQRTRLSAPFAGRVNAVLLNVGDYAMANQKALVLIDDRLDFIAHVRGEVARSLKLQDKVLVRVGTEQREAVVVAVQPDPDASTFTHEIRLRMPVEEHRSGMQAVATLPLETLDDVLVVPRTAVLQEEGAAYVFQVEDGHLTRVPVQLGARVDQQQVVSGLTAGAQIVVRDVAALSDGQAVVIDTSPS